MPTHLPTDEQRQLVNRLEHVHADVGATLGWAVQELIAGMLAEHELPAIEYVELIGEEGQPVVAVSFVDGGDHFPSSEFELRLEELGHTLRHVGLLDDGRVLVVEPTGQEDGRAAG